MAQNSTFLQNFQSSMDELNKTNQKVQDNIKQKKEFSSNLLGKLKDINVKIKTLAAQINQLKTVMNGFQKQVTVNDGSIDAKDKEINELKTTVKGLEGEKQQLVQQLSEYQKKCADDKNMLQQKIDAQEQQVRKLMDENTAIKKQLDALSNELKSKDGAQKQNIDKITELTEIVKNNEQKMQELLAQIKEKDAKIANLEKQLTDKTKEVANEAQKINDALAQSQQTIEQLNQQITELKRQNDNLLQKIIAATQAIKEATANLELLIQTDATADSAQYNQIFNEIDQSIQNISSIIQVPTVSQNPNGPPPQKPVKPLPKISQNEIIQITSLEGTPLQVEFKDVLAQLSSKSSASGNVQKYKDALQQMQNAQSSSEVPSILSRNGIVFKNGKLMGGNKSKKTKKNNRPIKQVQKQKGGFSYRKNTKRRSVTTYSVLGKSHKSSPRSLASSMR